MVAIGKLSSTPGKEYITFNQAKRQIRDFAKTAGLDVGSSTFRPRKMNRGQLLLSGPFGSLMALRKPGAEIIHCPVKSAKASELTAEEIAAITNQG
jgi:hypothetical protein